MHQWMNTSLINSRFLCTRKKMTYSLLTDPGRSPAILPDTPHPVPCILTPRCGRQQRDCKFPADTILRMQQRALPYADSWELMTGPSSLPSHLFPDFPGDLNVSVKIGRASCRERV